MARTPKTELSREEKKAKADAAEQEALLREVDEAVRQGDMESFLGTWGKPLKTDMLRRRFDKVYSESMEAMKKKGVGLDAHEEDERCMVCLTGFEGGDEVGWPFCGHRLHRDCRGRLLGLSGFGRPPP